MKAPLAIVLLALTMSGGGMPRAQEDEGVRLLLGRVERIVQAGDTAGFVALLSASADRIRARDFASSELMPGVNRSVLQERDRQSLPGTLPGNGYRLMVDVLAEFGSRARIATWRLDVKRTGDARTDREWSVADQERLSSVESIYRVSLNATKQYTARNLKIGAAAIHFAPSTTRTISSANRAQLIVIGMVADMSNEKPLRKDLARRLASC